MVSEWSPPEPSADVAPDGQEGLTTIGATSWRPVTGQPVEGRYVSESPRLKEHDANEGTRAETCPQAQGSQGIRSTRTELAQTPTVALTKARTCAAVDR